MSGRNNVCDTETEQWPRYLHAKEPPVLEIGNWKNFFSVLRVKKLVIISNSQFMEGRIETGIIKRIIFFFRK